MTKALPNFYFGLIVFLIIGCAEHESDTGLTPASESACNRSCGFEFGTDQSCATKPAVIQYMFGEIFTHFKSIEVIVRNNPLDSCFCGYAKLEPEGRFSFVEIKSSTGNNMGEAIRRELLNAKFQPVPDAAKCLLTDEKLNPLPISFENTDR